MQAASLLDGLSFDGFPPFKYSRSSAEVDVSRRQVVQALVVSTVVVVLDELVDAVGIATSSIASILPSGIDISRTRRLPGAGS